MSPLRRALETEARYLLSTNHNVSSQLSELAGALAKELDLIVELAPERRDTDCYYDDARMSLQAKGLALRIRNSDELQPILTLKQELGREGGLHLRGECEGPLDLATVRDLANRLRDYGLEVQLDGSGEIEGWQDFVVALRLRPVVVLTQTRQKIWLKGRAKADAEISLDKICYLWPVASLGPTVLEIECFSGTGRTFFDAYEAALSENWPGLLVPTFLSKKEIGLALPRQRTSG